MKTLLEDRALHLAWPGTALVLLIAITGFALAAVPSAAQPFDPVNPDASDGARALLRYVYSVGETSIIAGQHNYNHQLDQFSNRAEELTGTQPALWGTDFIWNGASDPGERIVEHAIQKYRDGSIVTLMWHAGRPIDSPPFEWRTSIQGELTELEWTDLLTPGTPIHDTWLRQVDTIAGYLSRLRDAGVPVLWRPYHEMNGVWFWWGDKKGADGYSALWRMLYDRFVNFHNLTNLIWVWNANAPRDIPFDQAYSYADYFPGIDYVDILATDVYNFDYEQRDYEELLRLADGKPIALGEVGQLPKPEILEAQPRFAWFMVWSSWIDTHNTPERVQSVYNHPMTITLDELPTIK